MPGKITKKGSEKELERSLKKILRELEKLSAKQQQTSRDLHKLKKQIRVVKSCTCGKSSKKKKKTVKSKPTKENKVSVTPVVETVHTADTSTPIGLLSMVSAPVGGVADDLKWISGVGPKLEETLNELGIFHFEQIANWNKSETEWVDDYLQFSGRIERDNWIGQAKALAKGGWDEYVKVFGKEPK